MNGFIYKLSYNDELLYVGSTSDVDKRIIEHKSSLKNNNTIFFYEYLREKNLNFNDLILEIIECKGIQDIINLRNTEGNFIRMLNPKCNKKIDGRTKKEYNKEYEKTPQYKEYMKEYQKTPQRKEYLKEYAKTPQRKESQKEYQKTPQRKSYLKEYQKEYQQTPQYKEYQKEYNNSPERIESQKKWREKNKEQISIKQKDYYQKQKNENEN